MARATTPDEAAPMDHRQLHLRGAHDTARRSLEVLRARGERVTTPRRLVIEALAESPDHLTADDVAARVAASDVHRATVYRTLDLLVASSVVSVQRPAGGATRYHLSAGSAGHGHLHGHCRTCDRVITLPSDAFDTAIARLRDRTGFELQPDYATFEGVCSACRG